MLQQLNLSVMYSPNPVVFMQHDCNMNKKEAPDVKNTMFLFHSALLWHLSPKNWSGIFPDG